MKTLRIIKTILFSVVIILPIAFFNFTPNTISAIDNRKLAENPLTADGDLTENIENYVNDRIGLRDEMIYSYTVLNDELFGKMVHPSYTYGKDGYIFGEGVWTNKSYNEYHVAFAEMVKEIQTYCEQRNVPFLLVFNPAKPAVYQDKIADGINYDRKWVDDLFAKLDSLSVNYLDNTETLTALAYSGNDGFNVKYDANHWNYTGAFYGTQKIQERLKQLLPSVHVNNLSEFTVSQSFKDSLLVSKFPIEEYVPEIKPNGTFQEISDRFNNELNLDPQYHRFGYYKNEQRAAEGAPKALVFQGSYMNEYGTGFMANSFSEYIHVHDYQNITDFAYYFNIFQPDCVVFEVAEYTFSNTYFNYEKMRNATFNPTLSSLSEGEYTAIDISAESLTVNVGKALTTVTWSTEQNYEFVWVKGETEFDMKPTDGGYSVTLTNEQYEVLKDNFKIYVS